MAAVDVSRVVALTNKAEKLKIKGHYARAAEIYAEAVTAAQALQQPDCLVVADMQASHADALLARAQTAGVPEARRLELARTACLELLPACRRLWRRWSAAWLLARSSLAHAGRTRWRGAQPWWRTTPRLRQTGQTQQRVCRPPQKRCWR
jgi:hypothetical protein